MAECHGVEGVDTLSAIGEHRGRNLEVETDTPITGRRRSKSSQSISTVRAGIGGTFGDDRVKFAKHL
jgi:hypothetical protein